MSVRLYSKTTDGDVERAKEWAKRFKSEVNKKPQNEFLEIVQKLGVLDIESCKPSSGRSVRDVAVGKRKFRSIKKTKVITNSVSAGPLRETLS